MNRRNFLKGVFGLGASLGVYGLSFLPVPAFKTDYAEPDAALPVTANPAGPTDPASLPNQLKLPSLVLEKPFLNAQAPLLIPTYDGSGQANHPSVIDFKTEHNLDTFEGYRFWMAVTPYPFSDYTLENPSILVSKDGINWLPHPRLKNPGVQKVSSNPKEKKYNSDPELVYDPEQKVLLVYWREYFHEQYEKIWRKKIMPIQEDKTLCYEQFRDRKKGLILSPTIWHKNPQEWYMWTTNGESIVNLFSSKNGVEWHLYGPCKSPWNTWNGGYIPWRIAAKPNLAREKIEFLIAGWPKDASIANCQLLYAMAPINQPTELTMPLEKPLLTSASGQQWDNGFIYRSSFVVKDSDITQYQIWYSAASKNRVWHIGYTDGKIKTVFTNSPAQLG